MRVGLVPFLNVAPLSDIPYDITYAVPSKLNLMMRNKELDVAFCSSVEYFEGNYERVQGLGLAAHQAIKSVNLYLQGPLDHAKIRLDPSSATSNALLQILCEGRATFDEKGTSHLLIGDAALKQPCKEGFETIDLASWWYEKTRLPFVFALFIKQKGVDTAELEEALFASLKRFGPQIDDLAKEHGLAKKQLIDYFNLCHYQLGPLEEQGLEYFHECQRDLLKHSA